MTRHISSFGLVIITVIILSTIPALAHTGSGHGGGFSAGLTHPIFGLDHVAAMVAVGLWGAFLGAPAIWILPIAFPLVMALGAAAGIIGIPVPGIEIGIALSAVILGTMIALALRPPIWAAALIVGIFAIFHGHAHGTELPHAVSAWSYAAGFVISTGLLHMAGIAFGLLAKWPAGKIAIRVAGGVIALAGIAFVTGIL